MKVLMSEDTTLYLKNGSKVLSTSHSFVKYNRYFKHFTYFTNQHNKRLRTFSAGQFDEVWR